MKCWILTSDTAVDILSSIVMAVSEGWVERGYHQGRPCPPIHSWVALLPHPLPHRSRSAALGGWQMGNFV